MKQGFIIPVYRHAATAGPLAEKLASGGLPVILIDDGNDGEGRACLENRAAKAPGLVLVRLEKNRGKGAAMAKGFEKASELGLTHVLQIDADGQHDITRVDFFLKEAEKQPDRVICGLPVFDESAPGIRLGGRKIANFWAAVVTLSNELPDVLCGFRVYPVEESLRITRDPFTDKRMGIDSELLVRLYWNRVFPVFHPVKISYPSDGISNYRYFWDNLHIAWVYVRLFFGMLLRLPRLLVIRYERRKES